MAILKWKSWESMGAESCARTALARARFQTAPTSLLTLQTCGGGLCLGHVKIMNSRSALLRAMGCAGRRGWCARCLQGTGKPPRDQSSEQARSRRTDHKSNLLLSIFRVDLQLRMEVLSLATDGEERVPMEGRHLNVVKSFVS